MGNLSVVLLVLVIASTSCTAGKIVDDDNDLRLLDGAGFPASTAERLIRALNLLPKDPSPQSSFVANDVQPGSIVERSLRFPSLSAGIQVDDLGHSAGYYRLPHTHDARMFYLFFESRQNKKDPVASNLIYVDQPTGTGFSFSSDGRDIRHDENGVCDDLYDFLQAFFTHHPDYVDNDFYITGESYAGHYIPAFASRVHQGNKAKEGIHINLKGFAIGNGLTDPAIQYKAYTDYALEMGIIKDSDYKRINKIYPACEMAIKLCGTSGKIACIVSYLVCNVMFSSILKVAGNINYYDVRKECKGSLCYDFSNMEKFLNLKSVRDSLGVGEIKFVSCSPTVYQAMLTDWMRDMELGIPALLEDGIKLLVYAGEYDLICNWLGNSRWVHAMEWSGQQAFVSSAEKPFIVDGKEAGVLKTHGPLSFLKVHDAGHMVPMDQPNASLEMLRRWIKGELAAVEETASGYESHLADM
ncbi:hypothetical protein HPP92_008503 [Vanilla planifolia]|uniref:Carboxypeptidase n=1 Tax=Vanilla planifolia TaxID=51239 RepID=A0A835R8Y9_VANPL|nr:hypothetical protein HPP92_008503 [Vanilla planifolia]